MDKALIDEILRAIGWSISKVIPTKTEEKPFKRSLKWLLFFLVLLLSLTNRLVFHCCWELLLVILIQLQTGNPGL